MQRATSYDLCKALAEKLHSSHAFQKIAQDAYNKNWAVEIGFDHAKQDWRRIAPFVVLSPQVESEAKNGLQSYTVELLMGVVDPTISGSPVRSVDALQFLSNQALPTLLQCAENFSGMGRIFFSDYECAFSLEAFPLIHCAITLNFQGQASLGERRLGARAR